MKKLLLKMALFIGIIIIILILGMFIPATPRTKMSLLFAKLDKDSLLKNIKDNRLILVGGSNLSFGINSELLKDSLKVNPINTGIHAGLGLEYLLNSVLPYVKKGDLIILSPEYNNFYGSFAYGEETLCIMFFDVDLRRGNRPFYDSFGDLSDNQWKNIRTTTSYLEYIVSKFDPLQYFLFRKDPIYGRYSFDKYGDAVGHLNSPTENYFPMDSINEEFNLNILNKIKTFEKQVLERGAYLFITFPPLEKQSYEINKAQINYIFKKLQSNGFSLLGTPEEFVVSKDLTFNTYYHLNKKSRDVRTQLLIKELRKSKILSK